jgi:hypothetical protein
MGMSSAATRSSRTGWTPRTRRSCAIFEPGVLIDRISTILDELERLRSRSYHHAVFNAACLVVSMTVVEFLTEECLNLKVIEDFWEQVFD